MKVLVSSDETGLVKEVICPKGTDTSKKEGIKPSSLRNICADPAPSVKQRVTSMTIVGDYLVTLRLNGDVCVYNSVDYELEKTVSLCNDKPISLINYQTHNAVIVAFETSKVFILSLDDFKPIQVDLPVEDNKVIASFVSNPFKDGVFAYGGEENDVKIVSFYEKPSAKFVKTKFNPSIIFSAENVPNDFLDLRVPVSIKHIRFMEENKFITVTKYGQLRIYDTTIKKRPINDFKIGPKPIMQVTLNNDNAILSDTTNMIGKYSLTIIDPKATKINSASAGELRRPSVKLLGKFNEGGNTGATHAITNFEDKYVATGGLDRYLRIFDINTRKLVAKVYLGTQISSIIILTDEDEESEIEQPKVSDARKLKLNRKKRLNNNNDDEDDDKLWDELESNSQVKSDKSLKKKSRKIV